MLSHLNEELQGLLRASGPQAVIHQRALHLLAINARNLGASQSHPVCTEQQVPAAQRVHNQGNQGKGP